MLKIYLTTIAVVLLNTTLTFGQTWEKLQKESEGGTTDDIAIVDGRIFMSHYSELYQSVDDGATWQYVMTTKGLSAGYGTPNYSYGADKKIMVSGDTVYFGNQFSSDGGQSWQTLSISSATLPTWYYYPTVLTIRGKNLYLGTTYNGFYQSSDFGKTFVAKNVGLMQWGNIYDTPTVIELFKGQPVIATATGIYRWNGTAWSNATGTGLPKTVLNGFPEGHLTDRLRFFDNMWIASTNQGVYFSNDFGSTWQRFSEIPLVTTAEPWPYYSSPAIFYNFDISRGYFFASYESDIYISADAGAHWTHVQLPQKVQCRRIISTGTAMLAATSGGIYRSMDGGTTWKRSNTGFERPIYQIARAGSEGFIYQWGSGVLKSTHHGRDLIPFDNGLSLTQTRINGGDDEEAFATVGRYYAYGGVGRGYEFEFYKSPTDSGRWMRQSVPFQQVLTIERTSEGAYLATGTPANGGVVNGLYLSKDSGLSWENIFSGVTHNKIHEDVVTSTLFADDTIYVAAQYSGIYKSSDLGKTWQAANAGLRLPVDKSSFADTTLVLRMVKLRKFKNHVYFLGENGVTSASIFASHDYGAHWTEIAFSTMPAGFAGRVRDYEITDEGILVANVYDGSFFKTKLIVSNDNGKTWDYYKPDFPEPLVNSFGFIGDYFYASGYRGLYRMPVPRLQHPAFLVGSGRGSVGSQLSIPIKVVNFKDIVAAQFTVAWDPAVATFEGISDFGIAGLDQANFGVTSVANGKLTFSWNDAVLKAHTLADSTTLFSIKFKVTGFYNSSTDISICEAPLGIELVDKNFDTISVMTVAGKLTASPLTLSGKILYGNKQPLFDVPVMLNGTAVDTTLTSNDGLFEFFLQPTSMNDTYLVQPLSRPDAKVTTGVDVADIAALRRHLLGTQLLTNQFSVLAADVNNSKTLSTLDIVLIDAVILGQRDHWPNSSPWTFVPDDFSSNNTNLFGHPESVSLTLSDGIRNLGFTGVKRGDVNLSLIGPGSNGRMVFDEVAFDVYKLPGEASDVIEFSIRVQSFEHISAYQFVIGWSTDVTFENISSDQRNMRTSTHGNTVSVLWDDPSGKAVSLENGHEVARMRFRKNTDDIDIATVFKTAFGPTVYDKSLKQLGGKISFNESSENTLAIFPNPVVESLFITWSASREESGNLTFMDGMGKVVLSRAFMSSIGSNIVEMSLRDLKPGVYTISFESRKGRIVRKIVKR